MSAELYKQDVQEGDNAVHFPDSYAENLSEGGEMISTINGETDRVVGMYTQNDSEGEISTANVNRLGEEGEEEPGKWAKRLIRLDGLLAEERQYMPVLRSGDWA